MNCRFIEMLINAKHAANNDTPMGPGQLHVKNKAAAGVVGFFYDGKLHFMSHY